MSKLVTLLETTTAFEAEVLLQILSWNGIDAVLRQDAASNQFRVEVREQDRQIASGILELSGNKAPEYPDKFAFISHTVSDMPFIEKHVAPVLRSRYMDCMLLNYKRFTKQYAQYILRGLSNSGWFLVIVSSAASRSKWVKFEVDWAIRNKDSQRIIPIVIDGVDLRDIVPRLVTYATLDFRSSLIEAERRLFNLLPEIDFRKRLGSPEKSDNRGAHRGLGRR